MGNTTSIKASHMKAPHEHQHGDVTCTMKHGRKHRHHRTAKRSGHKYNSTKRSGHKYKGTKRSGHKYKGTKRSGHKYNGTKYTGKKHRRFYKGGMIPIVSPYY